MSPASSTTSLALGTACSLQLISVFQAALSCCQGHGAWPQSTRKALAWRTWVWHVHVCPRVCSGSVQLTLLALWCCLHCSQPPRHHGPCRGHNLPPPGRAGLAPWGLPAAGGQGLLCRIECEPKA